MFLKTIECCSGGHCQTFESKNFHNNDPVQFHSPEPALSSLLVRLGDHYVYQDKIKKSLVLSHIYSRAVLFWEGA